MLFETILPYLFWIFLFAALAATAAALIRRTPGWLLLAAFFFWLLSMLAIWSVGWLILILPYIFLALAIGRWRGWIRGLWQALAAAGVGALLWFITVQWFWDALMPVIYWPLVLWGG